MRPTGRALLLFGGGLTLAAVPSMLGATQWSLAWITFVVGVVVAIAAEMVLLPRRRQVRVDVAAPEVVPLGRDGELTVVVAAERAMDGQLLLELRGPAPDLPTATFTATPAAAATVAHRVRPHRRGVVTLVAVHLRWTGPLGLLWTETVVPLQREIAVTTDVRAVRDAVARMVSNRDFLGGLKVERFVGDGSEFESLREFVVGMDRRSIDWKTSARHRELLARQFRAERDHPVMLCVDTGRLMGEPLHGMPRLDHAIAAALQLALVGLRTGDRVGIYAFAERPQLALPPQASVHAMAAIQQRLCRLDYGEAETNFTLATTALLQTLRRRTLVVMFTDFVDSVTAELMLRNVRWLAQRHVLLFVAMRDPLLDELADASPDSDTRLQRAVVAEEMRQERAVVLERLRVAGAQVLDADVGELGRGLVQRYLQIKRRELL